MHGSVPDIIEFVTDPQLLGLTLSPAQETLLRAIYGLSLTPEQRELWYLCTGREEYPARPFSEATVLAGARAGKDSRIAAPIVCYEAVLGGHERHVAKGERAVIALVAQDQRATRIAFSYIRDYLMSSPMLKSQVADVLSSEITLTNRLSINCFPSTLRSLRGWSIPAGVLDELAFFRLEGAADSDVEIQASMRRGMLNFAATRLVKISTPYMKGGVLYDDFCRAFGKDDPDLLVWRAPSLLMNPHLTEARLDRERRLDPTRFAREYEAEFAEDLDAFLPNAWIDRAVSTDRSERPPRPDTVYVAATDPSGGGRDAFTLAIVHSEPGEDGQPRIVHDVMMRRVRSGSAEVDLAAVVAEMSARLKAYRLSHVWGDRYSAGWVRQAFEREGITYEDVERDKSQALLETEPLFAQGRIELLDHPQLIRELQLLERRPRSGGRDLIDHPRGGFDDCATSLAHAAAQAALTPAYMPLNPEMVAEWVDGEDLWGIPFGGVDPWKRVF